MNTKNFIITDKGRKAGYTVDGIIREVNHIVCASEYDYYGQVHLYANSYFKNQCLVGVCISAEKEIEIDRYVDFCIKKGYLIED